MKLNVTRIPYRLVLAVVLPIFLLVSIAQSQPDFRFVNGRLESGSARSIGAVYLYEDVKFGVDCRVTITNITSGITVTDMDGNSGFDEALQPTLRVGANRNGYLEMKFQFYIANTLLPYIQPLLNVTCIDVDGLRNADGRGHALYEFDEINLGGGFVDFDGLGSELSISHSGTWFKGKNIAGIDYPGRDTSARQVMFTVINALVSTFTVRVGVDSKSDNSEERLRSVYFSRFIYPNFPLASSPVTIFDGSVGSTKNNLSWTLTQSNSVAQIDLERSYTGRDFTPIADYWIDMLEDKLAKRSFTYADNKPAGGVAYYRLKITGIGGKEQYSNIICLKDAPVNNTSLKVYPTVAETNVTVSVNTINEAKGVIHVTDLSGRIIKQQAITLKKGMNTATVTGFDDLPSGTYVVAVKYDDNLLSNFVIVR